MTNSSNKSSISDSRWFLLTATIMFCFLLFISSTCAAVFLYRTIPMPFTRPLDAVGAIEPETYFVNSLMHTPLRRNYNVIRLPIAVAFGLIRKFVPPLNRFLIRNRTMNSQNLNIDEPSVADMVIPPFNAPTYPSGEHVTTEQAKKYNISLALFFSAVMFIIYFLISLAIITFVVKHFVRLLGSATRGTVSTTRLVRSELKSIAPESESTVDSNNINSTNKWLR